MRIIAKCRLLPENAEVMSNRLPADAKHEDLQDVEIDVVAGRFQFLREFESPRTVVVKLMYRMPL